MKKQRNQITDRFLITYFSGKMDESVSNQLQEWLTESQDNLSYYLWLQRLWVFRK